MRRLVHCGLFSFRVFEKGSRFSANLYSFYILYIVLYICAVLDSLRGDENDELHLVKSLQTTPLIIAYLTDGDVV